MDEKALALLERTLALQRSVLGISYPDTLETLNSLAVAYLANRNIDKAVPLLEQAYRLRKESSSPTNEQLLRVMGDLATAYEMQGMFQLAEPLWAGIFDARVRLPNAQWPDLVPFLESLGSNRLRQRKFSAAESALQRCLSVYEQTSPTSWRYFAVKGQLGACRLGQGRHAEAEGLLLDAHAGLTRSEQQIPSTEKHRLSECVDWLVELYRDWGKTEKVAEWEEKRSANP
jgi:tetratricopeptide (TPR) repeat protein